MKKILKLAVSACTAIMTMSVSAVTAFAEGETATSTSTGASSSMPMLISLVLIFVLMYFLMIRPQKKKEKESKSMQENIQIGDEIVTIGGIVGLVVRKGDDNVVIETGGEKNKMRIKLWAISENTSANERIKEAQDKKKQDVGLAAAKLKEEKQAKKEKKNSEE